MNAIFRELAEVQWHGRPCPCFNSNPWARTPMPRINRQAFGAPRGRRSRAGSAPQTERREIVGVRGPQRKLSEHDVMRVCRCVGSALRTEHCERVRGADPAEPFQRRGAAGGLRAAADPAVGVSLLLFGFGDFFGADARGVQGGPGWSPGIRPTNRIRDRPRHSPGVRTHVPPARAPPPGRTAPAPTSQRSARERPIATRAQAVAIGRTRPSGMRADFPPARVTRREKSLGI